MFKFVILALAVASVSARSRHAAGSLNQAITRAENAVQDVGGHIKEMLRANESASDKEYVANIIKQQARTFFFDAYFFLRKLDDQMSNSTNDTLKETLSGANKRFQQVSSIFRDRVEYVTSGKDVIEIEDTFNHSVTIVLEEVKRIARIAAHSGDRVAKRIQRLVRAAIPKIIWNLNELEHKVHTAVAHGRQVY